MEAGGATNRNEAMRFVEEHVRSLLAWDLVVFFNRHQTESFTVVELASLLGRVAEEITPEVEALAADGILEVAGGLIRYRPDPSTAAAVAAFIDACADRSARLALIARVLQQIDDLAGDREQ